MHIVKNTDQFIVELTELNALELIGKINAALLRLKRDPELSGDWAVNYAEKTIDGNFNRISIYVSH